MTGFEGIGDFDSDDPFERHAAHQAAKGRAVAAAFVPDCMEGPEGCEGKVEYRLPLSPTGRSFPRCEAHWSKRLDWQDDHNRKYPDSDLPPADFDPLAAGERWDEED